MKRIIGVLVLLLALVTGLALAVMNAGHVELNYYFGKATLPLSLGLVVALSLGALLGLFSSVGLMLGLRRENRKLKRDVKMLEKEVMNLRNMPLRDAP